MRVISARMGFRALESGRALRAHILPTCSDPTSSALAALMLTGVNTASPGNSVRVRVVHGSDTNGAALLAFSNDVSASVCTPISLNGESRCDSSIIELAAISHQTVSHQAGGAMSGGQSECTNGPLGNHEGAGWEHRYEPSVYFEVDFVLFVGPCAPNWSRHLVWVLMQLAHAI